MFSLNSLEGWFCNSDFHNQWSGFEPQQEPREASLAAETDLLDLSQLCPRKLSRGLDAAAVAADTQTPTCTWLHAPDTRCICS